MLNITLGRSKPYSATDLPCKSFLHMSICKSGRTIIVRDITCKVWSKWSTTKIVCSPYYVHSIRNMQLALLDVCLWTSKHMPPLPRQWIYITYFLLTIRCPLPLLAGLMLYKSNKMKIVQLAVLIVVQRSGQEDLRIWEKEQIGIFVHWEQNSCNKTGIYISSPWHWKTASSVSSWTHNSPPPGRSGSLAEQPSTFSYTESLDHSR